MPRKGAKSAKGKGGKSRADPKEQEKSKFSS